MIIIKAILKINPNAEVIIKGDNIDTCELDWIKGTPISKEDIKSMIPTVEQEIADEATKKINDKASADAKLNPMAKPCPIESGPAPCCCAANPCEILVAKSKISNFSGCGANCESLSTYSCCVVS